MTGNVPTTTLDPVSITGEPVSTQRGQAAQADPTLVQRIIVLTIQLGTGSFGGTGNNTLTLGSTTDADLCPRCSVHVDMAPAPVTASAVIVVYGLTLDHINTLTQAGLVYGYRFNKIQVQAGDVKNGVVTVFTGTIMIAYPKASQPEMAFVIMATPTQGIQLTPVPPTSFKGSIDGATVLKQIAQQGGVTIENNSNVSAILSNPYFPNVTWEQLKACAEAMNATAMFDPIRNVFAIWPKNGNRGGEVTEISPREGMIDYPEFQAAQVKVRQIFIPGSVVAPGHPITISGSQFSAANGKWVVSSTVLDISCQMPDGPWEIRVTANRTATGTA